MKREREDAILGAGLGCGCLTAIIAAKLTAVAVVAWVVVMVLRGMGVW